MKNNNNKNISLIKTKGSLDPSDILQTDITKELDSERILSARINRTSNFNSSYIQSDFETKES